MARGWNPQASRSRGVGSKTFFWKMYQISRYRKYRSTGPPPDYYALCYIHVHIFSFVWLLVLARWFLLMNNTKIFPYRKYFICIVFVFFIKLFRGGGGVSLSIIAWERCINIFYQYSHYFWICVCSGLIKLVPSFIQVLYVKIWMFLCVDTCMKALLSHVIISNKCLYNVSIICCFPLRIKMANFFKDIISETL